MQMTSHSRTALMRKLAGGSGADFVDQSAKTTKKETQPTPAAAATPAMDYIPHRSDAPPIQGSESFCFVMKNMFDPATETGQDWHIEIQEDVESECSKYGRVLHSYVEKDKSGGLVYVLFDNSKSAVRAVHQMHGRWFNKKQITVRYLASQEYVGMFPEARSSVQQARENDK